MENLYIIEIKILKIFLKDLQYTDIEIDKLLTNVLLIEREIDPVGFYTTIRIESFDSSRMKERHWGDVIGKTKEGINIGYEIFKIDNGDLLMEGFTYGDDLYPADKTDYDVWYYKVHVANDT